MSGKILRRFRQQHMACLSPLPTPILAWHLLCSKSLSRASVPDNEGLKKAVHFMSIISWILFGFVIGILGKLLLPQGSPGGFGLTILLGITGALLGGLFRHWLGLSGEPAGVLLAIVGSLILLPLFGMIAAKRS